MARSLLARHARSLPARHARYCLHGTGASSQPHASNAHVSVDELADAVVVGVGDDDDQYAFWAVRVGRQVARGGVVGRGVPFVGLETKHEK